jgi:hypothetical protein
MGFTPRAGKSTVITSVSMYFHPFCSLIVAGVGCAAADWAKVGTAKEVSRIARKIVARAFIPFFKVFHRNKLRKNRFLRKSFLENPNFRMEGF